MARSRSQRKQNQPESKKALIIFLVFFILTTIGGAFFGYQGFTDSEGKDKKLKDEQSKTKAAEEDRDFYQYQSLLYRRLMGHEKAGAKGDLDKMDATFNGDKSGWANHKDRKEVEDVRDAVTKSLARMSPDKEVKNYEQALTVQVQSAKAAKDSIKPFIDKQEAGKNSADEAKALLEDARVQYDKDLKALTSKMKTDQDRDAEDKKKLKEALDAEVKKNEDLTTAKALAERAAKAEVAKKEKEIRGLTADLAKANSDLDLVRVSSKDILSPDLQVKAVGRVVDRRGDVLFTNLGTIQKVTPQQTFSIHAVGPDGQPLQASKGSLEITQVFESGSQARVLIERNKNDPIQQGDVLANPNWNPDRKKHVAIVGIIDLTGEGRNQLREFRQMLERQNVVVDAYTEPAGNGWAVEGKGITRDTNYLIVGDDLPETKDPANPPVPTQKTPLFQEAKQKGVFVVSLANYLDMIGYQPPRSLNDAPVYRPQSVPGPEKAPAPPAKEKAPAPPAPEKN